MRKIAARIAALIIVAVLVGCGITHPPVHVEKTASGVVVHCEDLGEYPSSIGLVELREADTDRVVWRLEPVGELVQLHRFELAAGTNHPDIPLFWGKAEAVVPSSGSFILLRGTRYRMRVCAPDGLRRCGQAEFIL